MLDHACAKIVPSTPVPSHPRQGGATPTGWGHFLTISPLSLDEKKFKKNSAEVKKPHDREMVIHVALDAEA